MTATREEGGAAFVIMIVCNPYSAVLQYIYNICVLPHKYLPSVLSLHYKN